MYDKEIKGKNKSLHIEVLSTMKVAKLSTSITLLVNFTNSVRKADVYTKHLNYISEPVAKCVPCDYNSSSRNVVKGHNHMHRKNLYVR